MKKIPLLLLPGLLCDETAWANQINDLNDIADTHVATLNTPDTPQGMVEAALNKAPAKFALAGHSMGGWVALEIMKAAPERVTGLALLNTTAKADSTDKANTRQRLINFAKAADNESIVNLLAPRFVHNDAVLEAVKTMLTRNIGALINQQTAMLARQSCEAVLPNIQCPTQIIHSEYDEVFNLDDSTQLSSHIPSATLSIIPNSGHMSMMEAPKDVSRIMRTWLESIS